MKKMRFIREEGTDKLVAVVKEVGALTGDGCCVSINESVLSEALGNSLVDEYAEGGIRTKTFFYRFGDITLVRINDNRATVFDSYINDEVWIGEKFKNNGLHYHYSKGDKEQKHTVRISLPDVQWTVTREDKETKEVTVKVNKGFHCVAFNKFLWDMKLGIVTNTTDFYVYDGNESHHEKACWDNRLGSTMNLSDELHRNHHKVISSTSHQVVVNINTIEELEAFLEYLRND